MNSLGNPNGCTWRQGGEPLGEGPPGGQAAQDRPPSAGGPPRTWPAKLAAPAPLGAAVAGRRPPPFRGAAVIRLRGAQARISDPLVRAGALLAPGWSDFTRRAC